MMEYLVRSSACLALFYIVYLLFFRNTDRFQLNRAYLLMGLVLSFVLPALVIPTTYVDMLTPTTDPIYTTERAREATSVITFAPAQVSSTIPILYVAGAAIALLITFVSVIRFLRLYWSADRTTYRKHTVVVHPNAQPSSFFGTLLVRSLDDSPMIIEHEMVHIRQRHWIDLVLVEIAVVVLWFNPFIYLYRKSIAIQHEYIADRNVVESVPVKDYLNCMAQELETNLLSALVSRFNTQSIKQRIMMITNTKTYSAARYAIVIPVVAVLTMAFATRDHTVTLSMQDRELRSPVDVEKLRKEPGAGFGKRVNPATQNEVFHTGVDFVLAEGNSVYAPANGVVVETATTDSRGNFIAIRHDTHLTTSYSHLEKINVKKGETVQQGQLIGLVGSTGLSTGPHLHFEVLKDGKAVDPVPYLKMD